MIVPPPKMPLAPPTPSYTPSTSAQKHVLGNGKQDFHEQYELTDPSTCKLEDSTDIGLERNAQCGFGDHVTSLFLKVQEALVTERSQAEFMWRQEVDALKEELVWVRSGELAGDVMSTNLLMAQEDRSVPLVESSTKCDKDVQTRVDWLMPSACPAPFLAGPSKSKTINIDRKSSDRFSAVFSDSFDNLQNTDLKSRAVKSNREKLQKLLTVQDMDFTPRKVPHGEQIVFLIDQLMGFVTVANIILIGISCDVGVGWHGWIVIDVAFAAVFVCELVSKVWILGCRRYLSGFDWKWNVLEAILVILALVEVVMVLSSTGEDKAKFGTLRIVRCTRITRLVRVRKLVFFVELAQMVQGALGGMRTLIWAIVLISIPLYALALVLHEMLGHYDDDYTNLFSSLASSYFTVWRCLVAGDCNQEDGKPIFVHVCSTYGWGFGMLYASAQTFMTFGLFNVIVAIYVENIVAAAKYNDLIRKRHRLEDDKMMVSKMHDVVDLIFRAKCEADGEVMGHTGTDEGSDIISKAADLEISQQLFKEILSSREFRDILVDLDIALEDQLGLFESLDVDDSGSLTLPELIQGVRKLRGDPRRSDVIHVSLVVRDIHEKAEVFHDDVLKLLECFQSQSSRRSII